MLINGLTIPDSGTTTQIIPDSIGGWLYTVKTTISVEQTRLDEYQQKIDAINARIAEAQTELDMLQQPDIVQALSTFTAAPAVNTTVTLDTATASSSPAIL